jgi:hypothetical protein
LYRRAVGTRSTADGVGSSREVGSIRASRLAPSSANPALGGRLLGPRSPLTSEAGRLINGEISIPDHREVQLSITKLITFIGVLGKMEPHDHG